MDRDQPRLETPRLLLRLPRLEDLDAWAAFMADAEAQRHLGGAQPRLQAWRGLATMRGSWALQGFAMFSIVEKDSGQWVGRAGPWRPDGWPGPEVGWSIVRDRWGRGYATEAARACLDFAFDVLGWDEVIHVIAEANAPSKAVAARLGSRLLREETLPAPYDGTGPVGIWGQSRGEWTLNRERLR